PEGNEYMAENGSGKKFVKKTLSKQEIAALVQQDDKAAIAGKLTDSFNSGKFTQEQIQVVEAVFRTLVHDTEQKVRKALAEGLKESKDVPKDVIKTLAEDIDDISLPVLQFSEVLSDKDLVEILEKSKDIDKAIAISKRKVITPAVSDKLIDTNNK